MRNVAVALTLLTLFAAWPVAGATDDCVASKCTPVQAPAPPSPVPSCAPSAPPAPAPQCVTQKYYVYHGVVSCSDNPCRGAPPAKVAAVLWQETNGLPGLQRVVANGVAADTMLLL